MDLNRSKVISEDCQRAISRLEIPSNEFVNRKIFITGGTGFFGKWLLEFFFELHQSSKGPEIHVLSRNPESFLKQFPYYQNQKWLHFHQGDVRTFQNLMIKADDVIHAATESSTNLSVDDPGEMIDVVVTGTKNILTQARQWKSSRFLFTSSGAIYGNTKPGMLKISDDDDGAPSNLNPRFAYHESKRLAEMLCIIAAQNSSMKVSIARCFAFAGPYLSFDAHFAVGNFIGNALAGQDILLSGDGSPRRSYLYAADLVRWLLTILSRGQNETTYNVGSEEAVSIRSLALLVQSVWNDEFAKSDERPRIQVPSLPVEKSWESSSRYIPSTQRASETLGLRPEFSLEESIRRTFTWALEKR